ncbi:MAG: type II toxin-antitoxin system VapC family toxin [Deinococcales bacterium]
MKLLLDTNAYTAFLKGQENVVSKIRQAKNIYMSAIVVGELLFDFRNGNRFEQNSQILNEFLANPYVHFVTVGQTSADRFGRIATQLKQKGTPIPSNDIWIAAHVFEMGAELLSFDQHFKYIDGLVMAEI